MSKLINFYTTLRQKKSHNPHKDIHGIELPFRALVCSGSGSGKTNLILNLLYQMDDTFHSIIIVSKAQEPLYDAVAKKLKNVQIFYDGAVPSIDSLTKLDPSQNGLLLFDDMVLTPNSTIQEVYIRGRKLHYSSIYISQSFYQTPKIIRQNLNYIWLGRSITKRDIRMILADSGVPMSVDELERIYSTLTKDNMNFMLIDLSKRMIKSNINDIVLEY